MERGRAELRRSAAIRVGAAVLLAAAVTTLAALAAWGPLDVHSDVIGYPTFKDFNVYNYFTTYYLAVGFFPLAALALFAGFTWLAPRIGLAVPSSPGSLRSRAPAVASAPALDPDPPLEQASPIQRWAGKTGRVALVGAALGLELAVADNGRWWHWVVPVVAIYAAVVMLTARYPARAWRPDWELRDRVAAVNAIGSVLTLAGLVLVSLNTELTIASDGSVKQFDWLPVWLGLPAAAALAAVIVVALRRSGPAGVAGVERKALLLIAVPSSIFLLLQAMAGDLGPIDGFHYGELLGDARLVGDGWLPWRDIVLTHGIFQDVVYTWGREIFGDSVWGFLSGSSMVMTPLFIASLYFLLAYLFGRNWLFLLAVVFLLLEAGWVTDQFRLILWPAILLLLASDLDRPRPAKSVAIAFLLVFQAVVTPEAVPAIVAVALVLIAYEWWHREPGSALLSAFPRTIWVGCAGFGFAALLAIYLASRGALDDYLYISTKLLHGHALSGAGPPAPNPGSISKLHFGVLALAPPAALLISFAYAWTRVRLRRGFYTADWVMAAAAIFVLLYYAKFLSRMDTGHVYQPFAAALPLILYIVYRLVTVAERAIRARWPANPALRVTAHPISLVLAVTVGALTWANLQARVVDAPARHHPAVTEPPTVPKVGYTQAFDTPAFHDLERVVDTYLSPGDRFFDFSNTPLLFFYLMDRDPTTRYSHVTNAYSAELQDNLIDQLRRDPPKLIAFDNDSAPFIGLSNWDGIPTMVRNYKIAQWILDRYHPLLWTHGFTFYARRDQPPASQAQLRLTDPPITRNVAFSVQPCNWGYSPNFFNSEVKPNPGAPAVGAHVRRAPDQITVVGWSGDPRAERPAREVIATVNGRIVARDNPTLNRPDLVAFGLPEGFRRAGFQMQVPVVEGGTLRLYGVGQDGSVSQIVRQGAHPEKGTVRIGGREVKLDPKAVYGQINSKTRAATVQISKPAGSHWNDFRYLEVDAPPEGFDRGTFTLYDRTDRPSPDRDIIFQTLDGSPDSYVVPVGACAQWHGYRGRSLYLNLVPNQRVSAVRLIR